MNWKSTMARSFGALLLSLVGSTSGVYGAPPAAPCSLLAPDQVSAALAVTVGAGDEVSKLECQWSQPGKGLTGKKVILHIYGSVGRLTPVDQFNTVKMPGPFKGIVKTQASGVGDDAVYVTSGPQTSLTVKKGNSVFQIRVYGFPIEQVKAKEKMLALDVLAKL